MFGKGRKRKQPKAGMSPFKAGVIAIAVLIPVLYLGFTKKIPFKPSFQIKAAVPTANQLKKNSFVRIAGVNVGQVRKVEHPPGGGQAAIITMEIKKNGQPIHKDATIAIRPRIFLEGNFFVDLHPGTPASPVMQNGDTLPIQQASAPVQLDQVLSALNSNVRGDLQTLLVEYGKAISEGADAYRRSQQYWAPAYKYSAMVNDAAHGEHRHDLGKYLAAQAPVAEALNLHPSALKGLITDFNITATAFARESTNVTATLAELPRTLEVGRPALADLNAAFPSVRRLVDALRPAVRSTGPMIDATTPFIHQLRALVQPSELRGLVADLRPTIPALARLQHASIPLFEQTRAASSCQLHVILPWAHKTVPDPDFPPKRIGSGPVYQEAVKWLPGISQESTEGDANGQWFRVNPGAGAQSYAIGRGLFGNAQFGNSMFAIEGNRPAKPNSRPPIRPKRPCENQQVPNLHASATQPPPSLGNQLSPEGLAQLPIAQSAFVGALNAVSVALGHGPGNIVGSLLGSPVTLGALRKSVGSGG